MKPKLPLLALHLAIGAVFASTAFAADGHNASGPTDIGASLRPYLISADGSVIIGSLLDIYGEVTNSEVWFDGSRTPQELQALPGGNGEATARAVSADGNVIVGDSVTTASNSGHAAAWYDKSTTPVDLGTLGGGLLLHSWRLC